MKIDEFLNKAMQGEIKPLEESFEYMGWLQEPDLENLGMIYLHGDCHLWTQALHDHLPEAALGVISSERLGILHSFLILPGSGLALDAGGLRPIETVRLEWEDISEDRVTAGTISRDHLELWYSTDEAGLEEVRQDISYWLELTSQVWLAPEPVAPAL